MINKIDLAPYVDASLEVMDRDSRLMRGTKPFVFTNCKTGEGVETLMDMIMDMALFDVSPPATTPMMALAMAGAQG